ncbi:ComF family protein [Vagococcus vulneris]|uniref:Phosphoribosyltransferase domain-containing protein n=1 Tax=Vagococcus vulneris TaxID=1977869 RepID=A0A430A1A5_9ENTE|nr:ComF family protein [Vagococcus vulneris]RSU00178.1 hypothetical protein CBF37_02455 [Vagococcus vulneris]
MNQCVLCGMPIVYNLSLEQLFKFCSGPDGMICADCLTKFSLIADDTRCRCQCCCAITKKNVCDDCVLWLKDKKHHFFGHQALFDYDEMMHDYFQFFKFKGDYQLSSAFSQLIVAAIKSFGRQVIVVPIPISDERLAERGFNQTESMLDAGRIMYERILIKKDHHAAQSEKCRKKRLQLRQPFAIERRYKKKLSGKTLLLFDDIYTTGKTVQLARNLLYDNKADRVFSLSLAR